MTIPEIRAELEAIAADLADAKLAIRLLTLVDELKRRRAITRTKQRAQAMTPALAAKIVNKKRTHPHLTHAEIGANFNVNPGRVSEALRGKRK